MSNSDRRVTLTAHVERREACACVYVAMVEFLSNSASLAVRASLAVCACSIAVGLQPL